ncbi:MAG TPA: hypothetical protein VL122_03375 [Nitrospirota bacterium]|nr:hypothetical protein [Nitrospirota bacterium]
MIILLLVAGCSAVPFQETARVPMAPEAPRGVVEHFQENMPDSFQLLNTVVFEYNWRKFVGIGFVEINRRDDLFKVVCLNPMGVKLFELAGNRDRIVPVYSIAAFSKYGDIASAVGADIRRIYFDLIPAADARVMRRKYSISFRQASGDGTLEYLFAGEHGDLVEKNYYDGSGLAWRVSYYEYREQNGKRLPQGIVLLNYQYGYRLIVRQKEFHS